MPIYEYRCESCGTQLEKIQKFSDPALTECPACGKQTLVKLVSASAFRLKGSGWYETDFKTGGQKKNLAGSTSTEMSGQDSKSDKSDNAGKSATTTDTSGSVGSKPGSGTASSTAA